MPKSGDDIIAPTFVERLMEVLLAHPNFAPWPRCRLVRGTVPQTLAAFPEGRKVAYLSLDMNIVVPEIAAIEFFWDRLVLGAVVLLDDYGWRRMQHRRRPLTSSRVRTER
jgi:hypothetical protein